MKRLIASLTILIVAFTFLLPSHVGKAYADQLDDLRRKQEQIREEMEETRKELQEEKKKEQSLSEQVRELAEQVAAVQHQLEIVERRLLSAEQKVKQAEKDLDIIKQELEQKLETFKERLVDIYRNRDVKIIEVLTNSTSFTDFLVRVEMFKKIADHDMKMLEEIKQKKKEQEIKKKKLEQKRDEVAALKKETEAKKKELQKRKNAQQEMLLAVRQQKELLARALEEKEEDRKKIAAMIRKMELEQKGLSSRAPTRLTWPTPGYSRVTSDYGWRIHPILKTRRWHSGIDIAAPWGSKVVAAADGKVAFTGWYGAYGNAIIVMHGGGISTMYPHLSKILVKEGEFVSRGQEIGKVGSTGLSTGPHIHFEVMKNGEDINPWKFFR
ncbi:MAG: peptidase [Clostridiales bacterium]|nr:peptidase [Clostridiales bacterium]